MLTANVVETVRRHAATQARVVREEYRTGIAVCLHPRGFRFYAADAWTPPAGAPALPWSPPPLEPVAVVNEFGGVQLLAARAQALAPNARPQRGDVSGHGRSPPAGIRTSHYRAAGRSESGCTAPRQITGRESAR